MNSWTLQKAMSSLSSRVNDKFSRMILLNKFEMGCVYSMGKREEKEKNGNI